MINLIGSDKGFSAGIGLANAQLRALAAGVRTRLTCGYYRNRFDGTVWALRALGTKVVEAVGPLPPHLPAVCPPMEQHADVKVDVTGWSVLGFDLVGELWELHHKTRILPGMTSGRGLRPHVDEYKGEFEIRLEPA